MEYKEAGVNRESGYEIVDRIKQDTAATHNAQVLNGVGGFGALYRLGSYRDPVLVSGTDGVGTKLHLAVEYDALEGAGIDCVAMCVNDILCHGAEPLFFLDYVAYAELPPAQVARVVHGVAEGCRQSGAALVGGESAQMPGTYRSGDFDIAGFAVGVVEKDSIIDGSAVRAGDSLIGLESSGVHSNGFSLVRAVLKENSVDLEQDFEGRPLWRVLLEPTRIYVKTVEALLKAGLIRGMAHITGGGLHENVPRMFPLELGAVIDSAALSIPPVFDFLQSLGIDRDEMFHTFNMGTGLVLAVDPADAEQVIRDISQAGIGAREIGRVEKGKEGICIE